MKAFTILVVAVLAAACDARAGSAEFATQSRDVGEFRGVAFALPGVLTLNQGDAVAVTVTAPQELLEQIDTEVENGVLEISRDFRRWGYHPLLDEVRVDVTYVSLEQLSLSGSGRATAETMDADDLSIAVSGSGRVRMGTLNADHVTAEVSGSGALGIHAIRAGTFDSAITGSGTIEVAGQVNDESITISGSGEHRGADLQSKAASAVITGAGTIGVWATESLDAVVVGSGDIEYRGSPRASKRIAGSGRVRQRDREM